jgi:hypothetical protein
MDAVELAGSAAGCLHPEPKATAKTKKADNAKQIFLT